MACDAAEACQRRSMPQLLPESKSHTHTHKVSLPLTATRMEHGTKGLECNLNLTLDHFQE